MQAITSKINNTGPIQLQTIGFFSKCLYTVLIIVRTDKRIWQTWQAGPGRSL